MTWPIGTPLSRAQHHLQADIVDLARDSIALKRENAQLRQQMVELLDHLAIAREAQAINAVRVALLERLARELKRAASEQPDTSLSSWVCMGPMASLLESIKDYE